MKKLKIQQTNKEVSTGEGFKKKKINFYKLL